jgi:histone-lysine N-methyltransferase EZH2
MRRIHEGPCKSNPACSCNENCQPCTKFCGCAASCESRWWGCCCKTGCKRTSCPCLVANRECDPDACNDCHCAEALQLAFSPGADRRFSRNNAKPSALPEEVPSHLMSTGATTAERCEWLDTTSDPSQARKARNALLSLPYYCSNSQLQSARKQRTRVAHSSIPAAGCGLFIDAEADVGELIREYAGEAVTTAEADRRGVLYDMMNISYLFDMDDLTAVDATLLGNKIRFANHADKPNCACVVRISKGQHRIGIYAAKKLAAHEELFFNYGYRTKVAWQRDPSLARKPTVQSQRKSRARRRSDSD